MVHPAAKKRGADPHVPNKPARTLKILRQFVRPFGAHARVKFFA